MAAVESTFAETESPWPPANLDPSRHPGWHSLLATGCQWRALPKDFPPFTSVQHYFYDWRESCVTFSLTVFTAGSSCPRRSPSSANGSLKSLRDRRASVRSRPSRDVG